MASIRVTHTIDGLERDLTRNATKTKAQAARIVQRNVKFGNSVARRLAKESSGPHGKNYFKRITSEMTGVLEGEYGPHGDVVGNAVGAGWRTGPPNTDLEKSQDVVGPKFAKDIRDMLDGQFW